jgi:fumarate reductase flavoprotein subunit
VLATLESELLEIGLADDHMVFNLSWHDWLNLRSLIEVSGVIAAAALSRENSRGAHFRKDFPEPGELESSTYTVARLDDSGLRVSQRPVSFSRVAPGQSLIDETEAAP